MVEIALAISAEEARHNPNRYFSGAESERPYDWDEWDPEHQASYKDNVKEEKLRILKRYGYKHYPQLGNGHCFFGSISSQLMDGTNYLVIRRRITNQAKYRFNVIKPVAP